MSHFETSLPAEAVVHQPLLLIDDSAENLRLLEDVLNWSGYTNVHSFTSPERGWDAVINLQPALVILDLMMPGLDGYAFLERLQGHSGVCGFMPVLVYTADLTCSAKARALELGAADFLTKPSDAIEIKLRVRNFLRMSAMHRALQSERDTLETEVQKRTAYLANARREAVEVLASACEYRDDDTGHHAHRVGELSGQIALAMGLGEERSEAIQLAATLHDLGKIAISDHILRKPGRLDDDEYALMRKHVEIGAELLERTTSPLLQLARDIALNHHERWDGKGYSEGKAGEEIPLAARIVSVADAFDAMTNDRPYQKARTQSAALKELSTCAGTQFDPKVVNAIHRCFTLSKSMVA